MYVVTGTDRGYNSAAVAAHSHTQRGIAYIYVFRFRHGMHGETGTTTKFFRVLAVGWWRNTEQERPNEM